MSIQRRVREALASGELSLDRIRGPGGREEHVVLLVDASLSMGLNDFPPTRLEAAKAALVAFVERKEATDPQDRIAVVSFSETTSKIAPFGSNVRGSLGRIQLGSNTSIFAALQAGIDLLLEAREHSAEAKSRMILLSDGGHNSGPDPRTLIGRLRDLGIVVDTVLVGAPYRDDPNYYDESLLRELATQTGGAFSVVGSSQALVATYAQLALKKKD